MPKNAGNGILLVSSLFFYAWGEPKYVVLMVASVLVGFFSGIILERIKRGRKLVLAVSIVLCVLSLGYFKYADFFIANINSVTRLSLPLLKIALPIGISFFTFQIISYIVDVYRKDIGAEHNFINFAAYVSMFPQLIAGPIVRYKDIRGELTNRSHDIQRIYSGISRFIIGLSKKVLIANVLAEMVELFRNSNEKTMLFYWIYAVAFTLQIYFDFSGYSDMAIGIGGILGFSFPENFNYPYIAKSITEYWRRWHITLGGWFRDYVYIPLGGNRVSKIKWYRNILVVWILTGLWHGASWNFVIWGLYFAIILVAEKAFLLGLLKKHKIISHIYVIVLFVFGSVIFNASDISELLNDLSGMLGLKSIPFCNSETLYYLRSYFVVLLIAVVGSTPLVRNMLFGLHNQGKSLHNSENDLHNSKTSLHNAPRPLNLLGPIALILLLVICTAFLIDGSFNPFLYFRF